MLTIAAVRSFALSLPEATEEPHFDHASFRVGGRIFATLPPDGERLHVFVEEAEARALAREQPEAFEELWWGKKLTGLRVRLAAAEPEQVQELLQDAWARRAPKRLLPLRGSTELPRP